MSITKVEINPTVNKISHYDVVTLNKRKPLWIALSNLFLDTELQDYDLIHIAETMRESDYSLDDINAILMLEVLPVCIGNMCVLPGGIWTGFDKDELVKSILSAKPPNRFKRWLHNRSFSLIKDDWESVTERFNEFSK